MHLIESSLFPHGTNHRAKLPARKVSLGPHPLNLGDNAIDRAIRGALVHDDDQDASSEKTPGGNLRQ
jgi:hypothetical protein